MSVPVLDGYSSLVEINHGGSSTIYSAHDERHNRKVAIKVLTFKSLDATTLESLQRELRAMGMLGDHPHIMSVHGSGLAPDGSPFMVMPLFTEGSYTSRVKTEGPLGWVEVADIGVKLCSALETAHRSSVLHRDIKPDNVFTGHYRTHPVLGDFGISTLDDGESSTTGAVAYTLKYAAPEVIEGEKQTKSSDIYSLGATFRYLLAGSPPFVAASTTALLNVILTGSPQPLPTGLPAGLVELLDSMIERNPANRPASCLEVANRLREIQAANGENQTPLVIKEGSGATVATPVLSSAKPAPGYLSTADDTGVGVPGAQKPNRGRRWAIGGVSAVAVLALLAVLLVNIVRSDAPETASSPSELSIAAESTPATEVEGPSVTDDENYEPTIFEGHDDEVLSVTGQGDGRLASASTDQSIRVWDMGNPDSAPEIYDSRSAWSMQGLADGRTILGTLSGEVLVVDDFDPTGDAVVLEGHTNLVRSVTIIPGERVASGDNDGVVRVWSLADPTTAPIVFTAHDDRGVVSVVELPGNRIASGGVDGTVKIWDLNRPSAASTGWDENPGLIRSLTATNDGRLVIGGFNGNLYVRDPDDLNGAPIVLEGHSGGVSALDTMKDGRIISGGVDGTVRVWDLNEEEPDPIVLEGHTDEITSVSRFGDNQVAAGSRKGAVVAWDLSES